jgi:hypothetical protein
MSQDSLQRIQEDLQTLKAATGLEFPYEPAHVRVAYVFALSALAAAVFAFLAQDLWAGWRLAAEVALVLVSTGVYANLRKVPPPGDARQAREVSGFTPLFLALSVGSIALVVWLAKTQGLASGSAMLIIGVIFAAYSVTAATKDKRLRSWYFAGAGAVLVPIAFLATGLPLDLLVFLMLSISVGGQALVWRAQLRALGRWSKAAG